MTIEYILLLLKLIEQGIVSSVTISQGMVTVRIKNNRPRVEVMDDYFYQTN